MTAEPGVKYAALYYKPLELDRELKLNARNFDASMNISTESKQYIKWWISNLNQAYRPISLGPMDCRIETDSSRFGYGGHGVTNNIEFSGVWTN